MTASSATTLVKDLKAQVARLTGDLRTSSDDPGSEWGRELQAEYRTASERGRTGFSWSEWRDGEVDLAALVSKLRERDREAIIGHPRGGRRCPQVRRRERRSSFHVAPAQSARRFFCRPR